MYKHFVLLPEVPSLSQQGRIAAACKVFTIDYMVMMQRQQIELVEAVRRLTPPAVLSGATQATASLSKTTSVPTAVLAGASSSITTTLSELVSYFC